MKGTTLKTCRFILLIGFTLLVCSAVVSAQTVIQMATYGSSVDEWQAIADAFNATHPGIKVEVQVYPFGEYIDKITSMVAAGAPPDVFQTWAQYKPLWVKNGMLQDLTSRWESSSKLKSMNVYPFMFESAKLNGRIFGIPYDYNSTVWFYNRDLLSERGLAEPGESWTVTDHKEMAKKLTDPQKGIYGTLNPVAGGYGQNIQWMENWAGHGWINEDGSKVLVDDPQASDMLQYWYDLAYQFEVTPTPGSFKARGNQFAGGYAMWQGWVSYAFRFTDPAPYDWGLALYPKAPKGRRAFAQGHMFSMPVGTKHPNEAWTFLEWMGSYEGQKVIVKEANREPIGPYPELWDMFFAELPPNKRDYVRNWLTNVLYGQNLANNFTYWDTFPDMNRIMRSHLGNIYSKQMPVRNEMESATQEMRAVLAEASK